MQYQIEVNIDQQGLQSIYGANQFVTLVKSIGSTPSATMPVAWLAFQPLESNTVTWVENYSLYATTTVLQSGASIVMTSQTEGPAQVGWNYTFQNGALTGVAGGAQGSFNLSNQMQGNFNFGLAQQATVNNVTTFAPLNAVPVLYNEQASFTPQEEISIFLSAYSNNGSVISSIAGNALAITLSSAQPSATLGFNDSNNTFYLETPASRSALLTPQQFASHLTSARRPAKAVAGRT
jgi:hypothetical protein